MLSKVALVTTLLPLLAIAILDFGKTQDQGQTQSINESSKLFELQSVLTKNWKSLLLTLLAIGIPSSLLLIGASNNWNLSEFLSEMSGYFRNSGPSLSYFNRARGGGENHEKVSKRGGNIGGLVNDGNTCFMNSVLQSLASSKALENFLNDDSIEDEIKSQNLKFVESFRTLLNKLNSKHYNKTHDYKTNSLLKTMTKSPSKNFLLGYNQEDAQEFFQSLLSELELDYKKIYKIDPKETSKAREPVYTKSLPENSILGLEELGKLGKVYVPASQIDPNIDDAVSKCVGLKLLTPVDGISAERIGCLQCGEMGGIRYSVISGLSLNLPPDNYTALKLTDLLKKWIEPEIIEGVNCNRCALMSVLEYQKNQLAQLANQKPTPSTEKLGHLLEERIEKISSELEKPIIDDETFQKLHTKNFMKQCSKSKQILISRPPPLLVIHINRSVFDPETYRVRKNNAKVIFPLKLDLDPFVAEPKDINTDARLPLSKKMEGREDENMTSSDDEIETPESESNFKDKGLESDQEENAEEPEEPELLSEENDEATSLIDEDSSSVSSSSSKLDGHEPVTSRLEKEIIKGPLVYTLRSVIIHYGTHNYGHYIAYRFFRGVWWRTSDENIEIVNENEVLSAPGVFMLFYELDSLQDEEEKEEEEFGKVQIAGESSDDDNEKLSQEKDNSDIDTEGDHIATVVANL